MTKAGEKERQQDLAGMRPKRLADIEAAVRDLRDVKDKQKALKEELDEATDAVITAMRKADVEQYGWKENGRQILVTLKESREGVSIREAKTRRAPNEVESDAVEADPE